MRSSASGRARADSRSRTAPKALLATSVLPLLLVAGCTTSLPTDAVAQSEAVVALPELSSNEELRDQVVRVDAAVAERASELDLPDTELAATSRLQAAGGMWDPWAAVDLSESPNVVVEQPMSLEDAPGGKEELAEFMIQTAAEQLREVGEASDLSTGERLALASLLSGRVVSGASLQISIGTTPSAKPFLAVFDDANDIDPATRPATPSEEESEASQSDSSSDVPSVGGVKESLALNAFDCVASSLLLAENAESRVVPGVRGVATRLEHRVVLLRQMGANDVRGPRCIYENASASELVEHLVYTDLTLLESDSVATRNLALNFLFEDSVLWARVSPSRANQVSVLLDAPADAPQSSNESSQSSGSK